MMTRSSSRGLYGELLRAGARIHEYSATMIHSKSMVVDDLWCVVGSTNLDSRSFGLNDEVNLVVRDPRLAARIRMDFERDIHASDETTWREWLQRPFWERMQESVGALLERQQ
jgi:cardiolipin synthase